jgi:hypothetical protein
MFAGYVVRRFLVLLTFVLLFDLRFRSVRGHQIVRQQQINHIGLWRIRNYGRVCRKAKRSERAEQKESAHRASLTEKTGEELFQFRRQKIVYGQRDA